MAIITGKNSGETLYGTSGNDSIYGGIGNDTYIGGDGNDYLSDIGGNNYFDAGTGNDTVYGDAGNDTVIAGGGDDSVIGWSGNDSIDGGIGNDYLSGGDGNDTLDGGAGNDSLYGGPGNDTYYIDSTSDYIYDEAGTDTAYVSQSFVKIPSSIENVIFINGAQALPYWISALLPDQTAGKYYTTLLSDAKTFGYIFPTVLPSYDTSADNAKGFTAFSAVQQARAIVALNYISSVFDLQFNQVTNTAASNILTFASNIQSDSGGYAYYPDASSRGSDVFLNINSYNTTLADGTYGALTLIHEIGHALGLKHPFSTAQAGGDVADSPYLTGVEDATAWTVMSYNYLPSQYYLQYSPLDIAALQYLYGPSKTARTGNDTYQISSLSSNFIWDGAGTDVIDVGSATQTATIYLTPGYQGYLGPAKAEKVTTAGQITVNFGTVIENLIGSNYNDKLYGNEVGNKIEGGSGSDSIEGWNGADSLIGGTGNDSIDGGAGDDALEGGDGNDVIYGGDGNDTMDWAPSSREGIDTFYGGNGDDSYVLSQLDSVIEYAGQGMDTAWVSFSYSIASFPNIENLFAFGSTGVSLTGNAANNEFRGTSANDTLDGGAGADVAIFTGKFADYKIQYDQITGKYTFTNGAGTDGTDSLSNIETVQFSDKSVALSSLDFTPPTISLISTKTLLSAGQTATLTFTLSEPSTNFIFSDVTVSGGTLSNFTGSGTIYTATFTPTANSTTQGVVSIASGVFTDAANNANADGSDANNSVNLAVDTRVPTYALSAASSSVNEGSTATFTLTTTNVTSGTSVAYTLSGVSSADITGGLLSGSATVNSSGTATISVGIVADSLTEGAETLTVTTQSKTASVTINDTSLSVPSYSLAAASTTVDEGSTATFTLSTTNVAAGTSIPYTVSGISAADVTGGALSGVAIVNSSGTATISIPVAADFTTEGAETLTVTAQGKSASLTVNDTSKVAATVRTGTATADVITNSAVSENIDGGAGIDTLVYTSNSTTVVISKSGGNTVVTNTATGEVDTLTNVERLKFADTAIALDTSGVGGQAYRVYQAAFNRTPDLGGLGYWMSVMDGGASLNGVAQGFVNSAEFKAVYGVSPTNAQIVTRLYDNVLHRPGETGGYNFWLGILDRRDGTVADVLAAFSESVENQAGVIGVIGNGFAYTPFISPTYSLVASATSVNEGAVANFTLNTTDVAAGTAIGYTLSGISAADVFGGSLSGNAVVNSSGVAIISVILLNDLLTEGYETLTVTAVGATASTVINDTSITLVGVDGGGGGGGDGGGGGGGDGDDGGGGGMA